FSLFLISVPTLPTSTRFPYTTLFRSKSGPTGHPLRERRDPQRVVRGVDAVRRTPPDSRGDDGHGKGRDPLDFSDEPLDHRDPTSDRKSTRLNSSHQIISYAVFCLKKK